MPAQGTRTILRITEKNAVQAEDRIIAETVFRLYYNGKKMTGIVLTAVANPIKTVEITYGASKKVTGTRDFTAQVNYVAALDGVDMSDFEAGLTYAWKLEANGAEQPNWATITNGIDGKVATVTKADSFKLDKNMTLSVTVNGKKVSLIINIYGK